MTDTINPAARSLRLEALARHGDLAEACRLGARALDRGHVLTGEPAKALARMLKREMVGRRMRGRGARHLRPLSDDDIRAMAEALGIACAACGDPEPLETCLACQASYPRPHVEAVGDVA